MEIIIDQPIGFNEAGKREHNEDAFYPEAGKADIHSNMFIVCDGVGGAARGEVASNIVCSEIPGYFKENNIEISDHKSITRSVEQAEKVIDGYLEQNPAAHGMGTTLSFLHFHKNGATVAWCGDSRVYQVRGNEIIFKSIDHSYVNDLLKAGIITPEEARDHPDKNVITRAIQGQTVKKAKVDAIILDDIKAGDLFFLCSDGVLEAFDEDDLIGILSDSKDLVSKAETIRSTCQQKSNDNYTFYLVRISEIKGKAKSRQYIPTARPITTEKPKIKDRKSVNGIKKDPPRRSKSAKVKGIIYLSVIFFGIISFLSLFFLLPSDKENDIIIEEKVDKIESEKPADDKEIYDEQLIQEEEIITEQQTQALFDSIEEDETAAPQIEIAHETDNNMERFVDKRDNKSYNILQINDMQWFSRNLEYNFEGSLDPEENGGRYYTWEQAKQACPVGWNLPSESIISLLRKNTGSNSLELVFSGHNRKNEYLEQGETAMFWFAESDNSGRPFYFSLKKGDKEPKKLRGEIETFKPVRCVRVAGSND